MGQTIQLPPWEDKPNNTHMPTIKHFLSNLNDVKNYGNVNVSSTLFLLNSRKKGTTHKKHKTCQNQIMCF